MSYGHDDGILTDEITDSEIDLAVRRLRLGKSAGSDGVSTGHIKYGGKILKDWLEKIFNRILTLEEVPLCLKEGLVTPIYKKQGKDPLLTSSYREITVSSVFAKLLESICIREDVLDSRGVTNTRPSPDCISERFVLFGRHFPNTRSFANLLKGEGPSIASSTSKTFRSGHKW